MPRSMFAQIPLHRVILSGAPPSAVRSRSFARRGEASEQNRGASATMGSTMPICYPFLRKEYILTEKGSGKIPFEIPASLRLLLSDEQVRPKVRLRFTPLRMTRWNGQTHHVRRIL